MANNCWNYAVITGSSDRISQIKKDLERATNNFTKCLWNGTFPKIFEHSSFKYLDDPYEDFGSKWFEVTIEQHDKGELHISGDSAWSPVLALFEKMSTHYNVSIDAEYEEPGCGFGGFFKVHKGYVVEDVQLSYIDYVDKRDPGRAFEIMMDDVEEGIFSDFEDFENCYGKHFDLLTEEQITEIKNAYENN